MSHFPAVNVPDPDAFAGFAKQKHWEGMASGGAEWNAGGNGGTIRAGIAGHGLATVASKKVVRT